MANLQVVLCLGIAVYIGLVCSADVHLTEAEKHDLGTLNPKQLTGKLKEAFDKANPKEHWCCKIHPTKVVINSRAVQQYIKKSTPHTSYGKCGLWGWKRCARNSVSYIKQSTYRTVYSKQTVVTTCPDRDVVCCKSFLQVAHNCLPLSILPSISADLKRLRLKGVLKG